jgi:hypothetical protein
MVYGLTFKQTEELSWKLAAKLNVQKKYVDEALDEINREEVTRIAKNEVEE